jgi:hypothetical protein
MKFLRKNRFDASMAALLRANNRPRPRVRVGADSEFGFPVGIFAAIIAAGIVGGTAATYFEKQAGGYR